MSKERIAIVTGASSGIGFAIAKAFIHEGYTVIGFARRKGFMMKEMESVKGKERFYPYECDISKTENVEDAFQWVKKNFGVVHILVNNAGIMITKKFLDTSRADWDKVFGVNTMGYLECAKRAAKIMLDNNVESYIVNINSIEAHMVYYYPGIDFNIYPSTKHATRAATEMMQKEFHGTKIRVTSISPGLVATDILHAADANINMSKLPFPVLIPEDIANAVVYVIGTPQRVHITELIIRPLGEVV